MNAKELERLQKIEKRLLERYRFAQVEYERKLSDYKRLNGACECWHTCDCGTAKKGVEAIEAERIMTIIENALDYVPEEELKRYDG